MKKEIKVLHCGDLHLDSTFASVSPENAVKRRSELRASFQTMIKYAAVKKVDIVLIAGDLFDSEYVSEECVSLLCNEFSENQNIKFVISPGNHDPYTSESVYALNVFPDNVHIFKNSSMSSIYFEELNTEIYGYAFTSPSLPVPPFRNFRVKDESRINILCGHCDMFGKSDNCPTDAREITDCGFDYAALGHIHNSEGIRITNNRYYGYCGCLEGRDFGECGFKGGIVCIFSKTDGRFNADIHGVRFSKRRYEKLTVDLTGLNSAAECYSVISGKVKEYNDDTVLQLTLNGEINSDASLSVQYITETLCKKLYSCQVIDKTRQMLDFASLENDVSIKGAYYRRLKKSLGSDNEKIKRYAYDALILGLRAINDGKLVDDFARNSIINGNDQK